jgi:hypothetical protein
MAVDLQMLKEIHRLQGEVTAAIREVKDLLQQKDQRIRDLPEYRALQDALAAVSQARARLKLAIRDDSELNRLELGIGEAKSAGATWARSCRITWRPTTRTSAAT